MTNGQSLDINNNIAEGGNAYVNGNMGGSISTVKDGGKSGTGGLGGFGGGGMGK